MADLYKLVEDNYKLKRNRSTVTMRCSFEHLFHFFGRTTRAIRIGDELEQYVETRRAGGAAEASIRIELALLDRGFKLAVRKKRLSLRSRRDIEKPAENPERVRRGFFCREQVEGLSEQLPGPIAEMVLFLFFSAWRVGEARALEWRDYSAPEAVIRLRAERSKNKHPRVLPIEGDLATALERRQHKRRLDCPFIFHRNGRPIGDFRKSWKTACAAIGLGGRILHDLRRSGVRHLINAGNDPHVVMAFSGHRTPSMLRRYHIINVEDLRKAAAKGSAYRENSQPVTPLWRKEAGDS